jgi:hypothetical protein
VRSRNDCRCIRVQINTTLQSNSMNTELLLRKQDSNKGALKEKFVAIYEAFFLVLILNCCSVADSNGNIGTRSFRKQRLLLGGIVSVESEHWLFRALHHLIFRGAVDCSQSKYQQDIPQVLQCPQRTFFNSSSPCFRSECFYSATIPILF